MKRKLLLGILCILSIISIFYISISRNPTVSSFVTNVDSIGYDANLTVIMSSWHISDEEKTKNTLIEQLIKNNRFNLDYVTPKLTSKWQKLVLKMKSLF